MTERTAGLLQLITGGNLDPVVAGYRWMCDMVLEEELYFRRHGNYRNSTFADVNEQVYQQPGAMEAYMDGLLASSVLWSQHAEVLDFYVGEFLAKNPEGYDHLEIGPGHGLLLYFAAEDPRSHELRAWDISPTSLDRTRHCLTALGVDGAVDLEHQDVLVSPPGGRQFDSVVMSELLEHLEDPESALRSVARLLRPGGRLYVNVPVNAPAIDHIYLLRSPEAAQELLESSGYEIIDALLAPAAGYSLQRARKLQASISCAFIATPRPATAP